MGKDSAAALEQERQKGKCSTSQGPTPGGIQEVCGTHSVCHGVVSAVFIVFIFPSVPVEARVPFPTRSTAVKTKHPTFTREVEQCIKAVRKLMPLNDKNAEGQWRILCAAAGLRMNVMTERIDDAMTTGALSGSAPHILSRPLWIHMQSICAMYTSVGEHELFAALLSLQPADVKGEYEARWNSYPWAAHRPAKRIPFETFCHCVRHTT
jgi:hypothetical protein